MWGVKFEVTVEISRREGILDPEGTEIERVVPALGYTNVTGVRMGRTMRLVVDAADEAAANDQVDEMCRRLLANPVIEDYRISLSALETA
ncbi:MAG: phosphoribosylformylglycinamidine synthase subunit PurS [Acidimicrobiia bacterium]|nr:phosphoribosylformylglycinamidine synthase subunit PurS [Acidimicrobiia bacterium]MCL4292360.1 phosphoribosylformylglycinamidine synthase subunit PurS [Acidimicrobiia bacterium]